MFLHFHPKCTDVVLYCVFNSSWQPEGALCTFNPQMALVMNVSCEVPSRDHYNMQIQTQTQDCDDVLSIFGIFMTTVYIANRHSLYQCPFPPYYHSVTTLSACLIISVNSHAINVNLTKTKQTCFALMIGSEKLLIHKKSLLKIFMHFHANRGCANGR